MSEFDKWYQKARFNFVDEIAPLKKCGSCGKDIISVWQHGDKALLLHCDKSMCYVDVDPS